MVIHSPAGFVVRHPTDTEGNVPPAVQAAAAAANAAIADAAADAPSTPLEQVGNQDLLGGMDQEALEHDFDAWNGINPPGTSTQADVHSGIEEDPDHINVTSRAKKNVLTDQDMRDQDKICLLYTSPSPRD